jgi:hypothetical protein
MRDAVTRQPGVDGALLRDRNAALSENITADVALAEIGGVGHSIGFKPLALSLSKGERCGG